MNKFVSTIGADRTKTTNDMDAFESTLDANTDLFFKVGASRGKDVVPMFVKAYVENKELALRIAMWARDVRGGAGERKIFRDILQYLVNTDEYAAANLAMKVPEIGRWDDLLVFQHEKFRKAAFQMIQVALKDGQGLAAKWMPRKGLDAIALRHYMKLTPKAYRKLLVSLTNVVETPMCAQAWDTIEFGKLPSLASSRYKKAFYRHAKEAYEAYAKRLAKGEDKVNAAAVYPYDVLKGSIGSRANYNETENQVVLSQWEALPNYMTDANLLAMVDVSGSMEGACNGGMTALDIAVSLGLYIADKNTGAFKDTFLTFSGSPQLLHLKGNVLEKIAQMVASDWGMNTDLMKAFAKILSHAKEHKVPQKDMPKYLVILSDMQFDQCAKFGGTAFESMTKHFAEAGYDMPKIVFWNLNSHDNVPVRFDQSGTALVSGFSPAVAKAILAADEGSFTPRGIMLKTVMVPRYNLITV